MIQFEQGFLGDNPLPIVWQITKGNNASVDEICAWFSVYKPEMDRLLDQHGAILLRGFDTIATAADFERVIGTIAPNLMDYVGGTSPRKAVHGKIMTATELPANYSIPLHQEMAYTHHPPDRIAFFCQVPPSSGGHTTIGDMRTITRRIDPAVRDRFKQKKNVQLRRNLPAEENVGKKPGLPKPWTEVFNTIDRAEVERIASQRGWKAEWLPDGSMYLWQEVHPATRTHPRTGDEVWCNQIHMFTPTASLKWARKDGRLDFAQRLETVLRESPDLLDQVFYSDGTAVDENDILHFFDVMEDAAIPVRWQRSDVLILDNILAAHGRTAFSGQRLIFTALIRDQVVHTV
jgi:alpha-ketoglutarate-dependent taurine dioxygenase